MVLEQIAMAAKHEINNTESFLLDSGSTCHIKTTSEGMYDLRVCQDWITVGNKERVEVNLKGKIRLVDCGTGNILILNDVYVVPSFHTNLISATRLMRKGTTVGGEIKQDVDLKW